MGGAKAEAAARKPGGCPKIVFSRQAGGVGEAPAIVGPGPGLEVGAGGGFGCNCGRLRHSGLAWGVSGTQIGMCSR